MRRKTEVEMQRSHVIKTARALVRLRHSLAADEELNRLLPDVMSGFDKAYAQGELLQVEDRLIEVIGVGRAPDA